MVSLLQVGPVVGLVVHPRVGLGVPGENLSEEEGYLANLGRILLEIVEACYEFLNRVGILPQDGL